MAQRSTRQRADGRPIAGGANTNTASDGLEALYGQMTSLDRALKALVRDGVDIDRLEARDLYERNLDCQNLGAYTMLVTAADAVADHAVAAPGDRVLDIGCGMGGPGRFLADRFGCAVLGIDLLPVRVEAARALTERTGMERRVSYRVASATELRVDDESFAQVWMLDVGIHVADKRALFAEIARVLRPHGLLVMHDQIGPLPPAMDLVTFGAPFIAPTLTELIEFLEGAGLRLLRWQDSTREVVAFFRQVQEGLQRSVAVTSAGSPDSWREWIERTAHAYLETLVDLGGRTGLFIAERRAEYRPDS
jgi:2-polyprenyl-3-methyl-5-hydroxy-6-metoxy-1,4-benzoquinol methylase